MMILFNNFLYYSRDQDFNDAVATFKLILRWCDESAAGNEARQKVNNA